MYTLLEGLTIAGFVLLLGAALFLAASVGVLMEAVARGVATTTLRWFRASRRAASHIWNVHAWAEESTSAVESGVRSQ